MFEQEILMYMLALCLVYPAGIITERILNQDNRNG